MRLLFRSQTPDGVWPLYSVSANGGTPRRLTPVGQFASDAVWSPDGSQIAYSAVTERQNFDVYVMGADGSDPRRLTEDAGWDAPVGWSPDGLTVLIRTQRGGSWDVATVPAAGGPVTMVTTTPMIEGNAQFTPDGSRVVFVRADPRDQIVRVNVTPLMRAGTE